MTRPRDLYVNYCILDTRLCYQKRYTMEDRSYSSCRLLRQRLHHRCTTTAWLKLDSLELSCSGSIDNQGGSLINGYFESRSTTWNMSISVGVVVSQCRWQIGHKSAMQVDLLHLNTTVALAHDVMVSWKVQEGEEGQNEHGSKTLESVRGLALQHVWERLRTARSGGR